MSNDIVPLMNYIKLLNNFCNTCPESPPAVMTSLSNWTLAAVPSASWILASQGLLSLWLKLVTRPQIYSAPFLVA